MGFLWVVVGVAIVAVAILDVFQSVIVPRPTGRLFRPSVFLSRTLWQLWRGVAARIHDAEFRESYLGAFAPFVLVTFLVFWIASLVVGYGAMFYGLRDEIRPTPNVFEALYFAGTSLVTIGIGDFAPTGALARALTLAAGASGLGAFAIITAFLFPIFGSYQRREAFVVMFTNRAGAPPSGLDLIETHARDHMLDDLHATLRSSELWLAEVLETHLAYPILAYFRSTHDDISWIAVVGTILDASTLAMTTLDIPNAGEANVVNRLGRHFVNDVTRYFRFPAAEHARIERREFDLAYDRLHAANVPLRERERAWVAFADLRATYASKLDDMATFWSIPRAKWFEDRPSTSRHDVPDASARRTADDARAAKDPAA